MARWPLHVLPILWLLAVAPSRAAADALAPGDFGGGGLMQIPTAEMGQDGDVAAFASTAAPYRRFGAAVTVLPWAEAVLRFTQITDVPYGPPAFSGNQPYLDRGIDARLRLVSQGGFWPDVTLGLRDVAGTGLFDAEYLVATGSFDDVDVTLGLGWGELAADHMFANPLAGIFGRTRPVTGAAGSIRTDYFAGPSMALFGGVSVRTPLPGVRVELELDPDDGREDPFRGEAPVRVRSPLDVGLAYRPLPWLAISAGYERGNTGMVKLAILGNVARSGPVSGPRVPEREPPDAGNTTPPRADDVLERTLLTQTGWRLLSSQDDGTARHAVIAWIGRDERGDTAESIGRAARAIAHLGNAASRVDLTVLEGGREQRVVLDTRGLEIAMAETGRTADLVASAISTRVPASGDRVAEADADLEATIAADLDAVGFTLRSLEIRGVQAVIRFEQTIYRDRSRAIGTAARAILDDLPPETVLVTFGIVEDGVDIGAVSLPRHLLAAVLDRGASSAELAHYASFAGGEPAGPTAIPNPAAYPALDYSLRPGLKTDTAGPDGLLLYDVDARARLDASLLPGLSVTAELAASLASDFDRLTLPSDSLLPHVRSDIADYLRDGKYGIGRFQGDFVRALMPDLYGRLSGGLLEDMFAGVDGEVLYRPYGVDWAVGADVNHVWQRGFHERFGVRGYQVSTAVLEAYDRLGWYGLTVGVKAGRYLAGDAGGTLDVSRTFDSGVKIGAFATVTTASGRQFGEGRFDKGIYVSVPLDALIGFASRDSFDYTYRPVTRDGGQLIEMDKPLYDLTDGTQPSQLLRHWTGVTE